MMLDVGGWIGARAAREQYRMQQRHMREKQWHFKFVIFRVAKWNDDNPHDRRWSRRVVLLLGTYARCGKADSWQDRRRYIYGPVTHIVRQTPPADIAAAEQTTAYDPRSP